MEEDALAGLHLQEDDLGVACQLLGLFRLHEAGRVGRIDERVVGAGQDLDAAVLNGRGIEGGPDGDERIAVEVAPAVLVPDQGRAFAGRFVHEHGAVAGHRRRLTVDAGADVAEQRLLHVGQEVGIVFEALDFSVAEGFALVAFGLGAGLAGAGFTVELHGDAAVVERGAAEHDVVHALLEDGEFLVARYFAQAQKALGLISAPLFIGQCFSHCALPVSSSLEKPSWTYSTRRKRRLESVDARLDFDLPHHDFGRVDGK